MARPGRNWPLAAVLLAAAALRIATAAAQLPHHFQSDEFQIVERALRVGSGELNPGLFTWPGSLVIYVDFAAFAAYFVVAKALGAVADITSFADLYWSGGGYFYYLSRGISVLFGVATVAGVAAWARRIIGNGAAWLAAAAVAVAPGAISASALGLPDIAAVALGTAALAAAATYHTQHRLAAAILAGVFLGLGAACKYHVLIYFPALAAYILTAGAEPGSQWRSLFWCVLVMAAAFVVACPFAVLDANGFVRDLGGMAHRPRLVKWAPAFGYLGRMTIRHSLGYALAAAALAGLGVAVCRKHRGVLIAAAAAIPFLALACIRPLPPRHILPVVPAAAVLAAYLTAGITNKPRARKMVAVVVAIAVAAVPLALALNHLRWVWRTDTRIEALAYVEANVPAGSRVWVEYLEPDVEGPALKADRGSLQRLIRYYRENGGGSPGRMGYLLKNERYPFGHPGYDVHLVATGEDWDAVEKPAYALLVEPDDTAYFGEQAKTVGARLTAWDADYKAFLRERGVLRRRFGGEDRPGPTISLYYLPATP